MPNWVNFDLLKNVTLPMYMQVNGIAWKLILPCFLLAIVITYLKNPFGSPEFLDNIKRLVLTALLLVAFPEIAKAIIDISHWIAQEINPEGINTYWRTIADNALTIGKDSLTKRSLLNIPSLLISALAFLSYLVVYIITYLVIATRHFIWMVLYILGPLLLLGNMFSATSNTSKGLFRSMVEVASWEILWSILFKVLATLGYAQMYREGDVFQTIILNLIVALAMIGIVPLTKSLIGGSFSSVSGGLQAAVVGAALFAPAKIAAAKQGIKSWKNMVKIREPQKQQNQKTISHHELRRNEVERKRN